MNYYIIAIGGTGAKCVEALIHLCAAGMMPNGEIYTIFVDPDTANGNMERTLTTLKQYIACRELQLGKIDLFKNLIRLADPEVWSPVTIDGGSAGQSLNDIFKYNILRAGQQESSCLADFFDVLYSPEEKNTPLEKGFRGHPAIGAAVLANAIQLDAEEPWRTFFEKVAIDIGSGSDAKIFVFGSIFGGTGAAGFPTIARLVRDGLSRQNYPANEKSPSPKNLMDDRLKMGGALILPYFSFVSTDNNQELRANAEDFLLNTQAALRYYHHQQYDRIYNTIYLLGDENMKPTKSFSIGAKTQQNDSHFIELYAALAAIDFFNSERAPHYRMVARHQHERINWQDLPDGDHGNTTRKHLRQLTRFAVAYREVYYPMLKNILNDTRKGNRAAWYIDFFERQQLKLSDSKVQDYLNRIGSYCESYLGWLKMIHTFADSPVIELINWNAMAGERATREFTNLVLPGEGTNAEGLDAIWNTMCSNNTAVTDPTASTFGKFIQALYQTCA